jgi:hypothetical protein
MKQRKKLKLAPPLPGSKRERVVKARERVLAAANSRGYVTNATAARIGGWAQAHYHLRIMVADGLLKRAAYNRWTPR